MWLFVAGSLPEHQASEVHPRACECLIPRVAQSYSIAGHTVRTQYMLYVGGTLRRSQVGSLRGGGAYLLCPLTLVSWSLKGGWEHQDSSWPKYS